MDNNEIKNVGNEYVMNTYSRQPFALLKGEGSKVWDADGKEYIDMLVGIAVNNTGHCHPKVVKAIQEQAGKLLHCSNLYWIEPQVELAKLICENSCGDKAFFCNSGAEANEAAIKLARKWAFKKYGSERFEIISAQSSFHGRTLAALTATGQPKYQKGFAPLMPGFKYVPYNDLSAIKEAVSENTCAIILEPVQGEGGVYPAAQTYLQGVRDICNKHDLLLIFDEVQTGLGRTGKLFGYEHYGIEPDIFTLAKGLGGGVPIGAMVAKENAALGFEPGDHASTFGGNPLASAAAVATIKAILEEGLVQQAIEKGQYITAKFEEMEKEFPFIVEIRGKGLMLGIELDREGAPILEYCLAKGLIINCIQKNVLRLVPALNITYAEIDKGLAIIKEAFKEVKGES